MFESDFDLLGAGIDRVLDQLAKERHRVGELLDEAIEGVVDGQRLRLGHSLRSLTGIERVEQIKIGRAHV